LVKEEMGSRNTQVLQHLHSTSVTCVSGDTMDLGVFKYNIIIITTTTITNTIILKK